MAEPEDDKSPRIDNFNIALRMRDFEINQLTQRNNFFMIFQGVLFAGLVQSSHTTPIVSFMVCVVGLVIALFQVGMASGAKFWQEYWEQMLSEYENTARAGKPELFHSNISLYEKIVKDRMNHRGFSGVTSKFVLCRFSVSRIPIYVGMALSVIWGLLILCTLRGYPPLSIPSFVVGF